MTIVPIGLLTARLRVRDSRSLKEKRQVVRSILDRLRSQFHVSAAEIDDLDDHQLLSLGIAAVGPETDRVRGLLQSIQEALRRHPVAEYLQGELSMGHDVV